MQNSPIVEHNMTITKASFDPKSQTMRIRMVCSDTGPDVFGEKMSLELFNDFTTRITSNMEVPTPFKSILSEKSGWAGGMPYVSVAHYKSGKNGANIPADTEKVYVDGEMLKATAICRETELGKAVFKTLKADLDGSSEFEDKVRVSIGFLDLQHSHGDMIFTRDTLEKSCPMCENGDGNKVYLRGQLVHLALTRSPANPRTDTEVDMSSITTKRQDAESIVGKALAEEIEVNKTSLDDASEILVVKAAAPDDEEAEGEMPSDHTGKDDCVCKACKGKKKKEPMKSDVVDEPVVETTIEKSALDQALDAFKAEILSRKSLTRDEALKSLQPAFELVAKAVQDEFAPTPAPTQITASIDPQLAEVLTGMKSSLDAVASQVSNLTAEMTILKSQNAVKQPATASQASAPRNLQVERSNMPTLPDIQAQKPLSIRELALRSVQAQ